MKKLLTFICALAVATCAHAQIRVNPITTNNAAGMSNVIVRAAGAWGYVSNRHSAPVVITGNLTATGTSNWVGTAYGDGSHLSGVTGGGSTTNADDLVTGTLSRPVNTTGSVTASNFVGSAHGLTDIPDSALSTNIAVRSKATAKRLLVCDDTGEDVDGVINWLMLTRLADAGLFEWIGVASSVTNSVSSQSISALLRYYGYNDVPVAQTSTGIGLTVDTHGAAIATNWPSRDQYPDAVSFYRQSLAESGDKTVTILSGGNLQIIADLINSTADTNSALTGRELMARKVSELVILGGDYPEGNEYNFIVNPTATQALNGFTNCPVVFGGYSLGSNTLTLTAATMQTMIQRDPRNPYLLAATNSVGVPRPAWMQYCSLYALFGTNAYGTNLVALSEPGTNCITALGSNYWTASAGSNQRYITQAATDAVAEEVIESILRRQPNVVNSAVGLWSSYTNQSKKVIVDDGQVAGESELIKMRSGSATDGARKSVGWYTDSDTVPVGEMSLRGIAASNQVAFAWGKMYNAGGAQTNDVMTLYGSGDLALSGGLTAARLYASAPFDMGPDDYAEKLLLKSGTTYHYGFGVQPAELRVFYPDLCHISFGTVDAYTFGWEEQARIDDVGNFTGRGFIAANSAIITNNAVVSGNLTALGTSNYVASVYSPTGSWTSASVGTLNFLNPWSAAKGTNSAGFWLEDFTTNNPTFNGLVKGSNFVNSTTGYSLADTNWVLAQVAALGTHIYASGVTNTTTLYEGGVARTNQWFGSNVFVSTITTNTLAIAAANSYIRHIVSAQSFTRIGDGPVDVTAYIGKTAGSGTTSVKPEFYWVENGTNLIEFASALEQTITGSTPTKYQWSMSVTSTNLPAASPIVWAWKVISPGTASPQLAFVSGGQYDSHATFVVPSSQAQLDATQITSGSLNPARMPSGTNAWALDTAFPLNTNKLLLTSGSVTGGITNVSQVQAVGAQFGELLVKATGDITFTNPAAWVTSDMVDSRIITNGNYAQIAVEVTSLITNLIIVQSK